jgi:threonine aldolase
MAQKLEEALREIPSTKVLYPRQANSVFVTLPEKIVRKLHEKGWHFYNHVGPSGARLMCSWDSTQQDVAALVQDIRNFTAES